MLFKRNGLKKRILSVLLAILLSLSVSLPVFAVDLTDEQKATLDQTVKNLKSQQSEMNATKNTIAEIKVEMLALDDTIAALDARMAETKEEIAQLEVKRLAQEAELEQRLRVMYMYGDGGYVELLFSAKDFAELLTRIDQVRAVMQSDRDCVNAIKQTEKEIEAGITSLEADKANVEALQAQQAALLATNQALLETQQLQYDAEKNAANQLAQSMGYYGIDQFISMLAWPTDVNGASAFRISDWFGARSYASTSGVGSTDHKGIDITPGDGTPILAAASGVVVTAEYNSGYGNVVVIEHGKNNEGKTLHTLYAHQSSYIVSVGQMVSQGEVIGYVGSTGPSTGAHLHFEVWEDKVPVDPMGYFEQYKERCVFTG